MTRYGLAILSHVWGMVIGVTGGAAARSGQLCLKGHDPLQLRGVHLSRRCSLVGARLDISASGLAFGRSYTLFAGHVWVLASGGILRYPARPVPALVAVVVIRASRLGVAVPDPAIVFMDRMAVRASTGACGLSLHLPPPAPVLGPAA